MTVINAATIMHVVDLMAMAATVAVGVFKPVVAAVLGRIGRSTVAVVAS